MQRPGESARPAALAAVLVAATLGAGVLGIEITQRAQATAVWWPAAGTGLLTLVLLPRPWWRLLSVALFASYVLANLLGGRPLGASLCLATADIAETLVVAFAVQQQIGRRLRTVADFGALMTISLAGALIAAVGISVTSVLLLDGTFWHTLLNTTSSHWTSVILIAPLGLVPWRRPSLPSVPLAIQAVLLVLATLSAFGRGQTLSLGYAPIPFLIWAGLSFGFRVVAVEQVVISIMVTAMAVSGWGTFTDPNSADSLVVQLYLLCLVLSGLPLALVVRDQKRANQMARREKQRTEAVLDSTTTAILVMDSDGILLSVNPATTRLTGFSAAELVGKPYWQHLVPPERRSAAGSPFVSATAFPERGEGVIRTASGSDRIVTYSNGVLRNPGDDSLQFVLTATDVTAERATSLLLQHLLRSATTVAILGTDQNGRITLVNAGAEAMLRIDAATATEHQFLDFLDPDEVAARGAEVGEPPGFAALVHEVAAGGASQTRDWTWTPPDGIRIRVSMTTSLIADEFGHAIGYLFVARDVTENRRNQEILRRALEREETAVDHLRALDTAKDDFVSTVSHELRTPLTSILGSTELLSDGLVGELTDQQREILGVIDRNADRLLALANDLLLLAAHETAQVPDQFEPIDLRDVVASSRATVMPLLVHRHLDLRPELPDEPVVVDADAGYLERAVTNLLTNAIKFTPDGGDIRIRVGLTDDAEHCYLAVSDTGIGIPEDELENVFVRFFRSSIVQAEAIQGTGLGLAIVRSIVESHRGRIDVESERGVGTTFTITLPLAAPPV